MFSFTCPKCGHALFSQYDHRHLAQMPCVKCDTKFPNIYYVPGSPVPEKPARLEHEERFRHKWNGFANWS